MLGLFNGSGIWTAKGSYSIKYSPGIIFSGKVPALDINFINPEEELVSGNLSQYYVSNGMTVEASQEGILSYISQNESVITSIVWSVDETEYNELRTEMGNQNYTQATSNNIEIYGSITMDYEIYYYIGSNDSGDNILYIKAFGKYLDGNNEITDFLYGEMENNLGKIEEIGDERTYASSAQILQPIVAKWYNALRKIALIGLLSVLVYVGIKIVLTSTSAKKKAKYKNMLKDWIVAICLLFVLHYIMAITITVVNKINDVITISTISADGEDMLMTKVRNEIYYGESWSEVLTFVIIYATLTIFSIIYTIQYVRRVIYLAFLTMIAPLITLTYPLDKIKDGKAQAFNMWLKDYIFFTLIQVVHALIYYIFLGTAIDLNQQGNWLFAIVAIGFITPAEKLIKKMFGFEKAKTLGAMGAGVTGALVMNAMQKIPQGKPGGSTKGSAENSKLVRTAKPNPFASYSDEVTLDGANALDAVDVNMQNGGAENNINGNIIIDNASTNNNTGSSEGSSKLAQILQNNNKKTSKAQTAAELKRNLKGAGSIVGKYAVPMVGSAMKFTVNSVGAAFGASTAIAKGEGIKDIIAGMRAGSTVGNETIKFAEKTVKNVTGIPKNAKEVANTWNEGYYGTEIMQNARFDEEFRNSKTYKKLKEKSPLSSHDFDRKLQNILDNGITDEKQIEKILKNHTFDPKKYTMDNAIKYSKIAKKCSDDVLYDNSKFIRYCQDKKIDISEEELSKLRKEIIKFK